MSNSFDENRKDIGLYKPHKGKQGIVGKEFKQNRKMKPLIGDKKENYGKYTYADGADVPYSLKTKSLKLELKNANRSQKKRERFKAKEEIKQQIQSVEFYIWAIEVNKTIIIEEKPDVPFGGRLISIENDYDKAKKAAETIAKEIDYKY
jgi:hypothetical protein